MSHAPPSPTRKIGSDNVSAIGYGAMGIASFYGRVPSDEERVKVALGSSDISQEALTRELFLSSSTNSMLAAVRIGTHLTPTVIQSYSSENGKRRWSRIQSESCSALSQAAENGKTQRDIPRHKIRHHRGP
jgi:hypothetical protein